MKLNIFFALFLFPFLGIGQQKPLDFSVYDGWNTIRNTRISDDGKYTAYEISPYKGDKTLVLVDNLTKKELKFERSTNYQYSANSNYIVFRRKPAYDSIRKLKLQKVKRSKLPKDSLVIYLMSGKSYTFNKLKTYSLAIEKSDWMFFLTEMPKDTTKKSKKKKVFDKKAPKPSKLTIFNPILDKKFVYKNMTSSSISRNGNLVAFNQLQNDSLLRSKISVFNTSTQKLATIFDKKGLVKRLKVNNAGTQVAFLFSADTTKVKNYALYLWNKKQNSVKKVVDTNSNSLPKLWTASENAKLYFSRNDNRLFLGSALRKQAAPKDTLLPEEKVKVDVWSWTDDYLQPQQLANRTKELKRTYLTEYLIKEQKIHLLADTFITYVRIDDKGNANYFLGVSNKKYRKQTSWNAPWLKDYYRINANTGAKELILKSVDNAELSPKGNYLMFYSRKDSDWFVKNLKTNKISNITKSLNVAFYDEENDYPALPGSYGIANWAEDESYVLIYDRYDIWKINLKNLSILNLTNNFGRKNSIRLHYMRLNPDYRHIRPKETLYLSGFNEKTKDMSYYSLKSNKINTPVKLFEGKYALNTWKKAKKANTIVFTRQTFKEFPNLWLSNTKMENPTKISDVNPQQKDYLWGSVELVKWTSMNGKEEEGLLYKPANFNPNKKYPMIVYFYRLYSDRLNFHYIPKPSRSIINFSFYTSNGYLVFVPNIRYKVGYPGKSAYDYIVGGTNAMINRYPFIDKKHIGIQGQSWGGYQVAYVVTQSDLFAAASSGAPVSNMTSAYGGIRWKTGMSRMFQYEKTQSRIGGTLWDKPLNYIENSPIFYAPKINTPLLIRHDDTDGAVPWYQGIELFVALRRLNKPAWLLNYNGQPHNLKAKSPAGKDLSIRMMQFFDHYLKGKPAPVWMTKGIPAIKKGKTLGYELEE